MPPDPVDGIGQGLVAELTVTPIGVVHSPFRERSDAPRQPRADGTADTEGTVELFAGRGYEDALSDLALWDHVWVVFWFDRNREFRPKVQPPRSDVKRGLFATRSPYRPNPIGISALRLIGVDGLTLRVGGLDLLDGTPVLDIKPYVPYTDSIPSAGHGWLDPGEPTDAVVRDPRPAYQVAYTPLAQEQLAFLREQGISLQAALSAQLALGPSPHAYRRIKQDGDKLRIALKDWRAWFTVQDRTITVERLGSGYRLRELATAPPAHQAFVARFS
ncbi:MAG: tRNA (N6-threonylcarbamoyladenosine(37)-N6)-methyltransferase TrmO [Polyangiales bacterium]